MTQERGDIIVRLRLILRVRKGLLGVPLRLPFHYEVLL